MLALTIIFISCSQDDIKETNLSNHVGFEQGPLVYRIADGATADIDIKVAASETLGSDRTYNIIVNTDESNLASAYTVPSTVTIPANSNVGTLPISVTDDENLSFVAQTLVLDFQDEAGTSFGIPIALNIAEECLNTLINLSLEFDTYPDEAYWELYDLSGTPTLVQSGGENSAYAGLTDFSSDFCLPSGMYGIVVYDTYGDGGTDYTVTMSGDVVASGSTPDAGGGYPVLTNSSSEFTID